MHQNVSENCVGYPSQILLNEVEWNGSVSCEAESKRRNQAHNEIRTVKIFIEKCAGFRTEVISITERSNAEDFHKSTANNVNIKSDKRQMKIIFCYASR